MKTFTIELSDDAAGMLAEIQAGTEVTQENIIRVCMEGSLADAFTDGGGLGECFVEEAADPGDAAAKHWKAAYDLFDIN